MVSRRAKSGKNAGNYFYGCSNFPRCRGTLPGDSNTNKSDSSYTPLEYSPRIEFPKILHARSRFQNYQSRFFECVAAPEQLLLHFSDYDSNNEKFKLFAQWRLDFPTEGGNYSLNETKKIILSVIEKILMRGRITMLSQTLEEKLTAQFGPCELNLPTLPTINSANRFDWFDSEEESIFYSKCLPNLISKKLIYSLIPQVEIRSLLPAGKEIETKASRVDFALFIPGIKKTIVIEIDGAQHKQHLGIDHRRDSVLEENGITVVRIPVDEVRNSDGPNISHLEGLLNSGIEEGKPLVESQSTLISACKLSHQIQLTVFQGLLSGFLDFDDYSSWYITSDINNHSFLDNKSSMVVLKSAISDFLLLLNRLKELYKFELTKSKPKISLISNNKKNKNERFGIIFKDSSISNTIPFYVQNIYVPFHIASATIPINITKKNNLTPSEKEIEFFLKYLFRKNSLWEGQYDSVLRTLSGEDSLILLPTGAGKSIIYQLSSLLLPGRSIVIDPIISLIDDQMDNLRVYGIDRCIGITSQIEAEDRSRAMKLFGQGEYLFGFIAPERFQTTEFRDSLRTLTVHTPISAIVVDEAHCVSEWGHDFRTSYLNIGRTSREYCESNKIVPPLLALTGTASRAVLKDVQRELQIEDFESIVTPKSFDRPELKFRVLSAPSAEKGNKLKGFLGQVLPAHFNVTNSTFYLSQGAKTYAGIIFCPWVNGEYGVTQVTNEIVHELGINASHYSGKPPKGWDSRKHKSYKRETVKSFKRNQVPLLVSTKAFGMGIDKPNIRYTIHFGIPQSIEAFYQEAGRAGRDRSEALCCLIVSNDDEDRSKKLLSPTTTVEQISETLKNLDRDQNDDITRNLFFHLKSFKGVIEEKQTIESVIEAIGDISKKKNVKITLPNHDRNVTEKALHRLLIIGIITDYTINYSNGEFSVKVAGVDKQGILASYGDYVGGYLESRKQTEIKKANLNLSNSFDRFVLSTIELLLKFVYDVIERGRRRALLEMLLACTVSVEDADIRSRILRYLEATEYSEKLDDLLADEGAGFVQCKDIFSTVRSPNEAAEIRGQVSRYLESYPDHPGLLMLRFLSELLSKDTNLEISHQNFQAAAISARDNYGIDSATLNGFGAWAISKVPVKYYEFSRSLVLELITANPASEETRELVKHLPLALADIPAYQLLFNLELKSRSLIN